ncbi:MAG: peroxiredoxin-like family protein [Acidobacteriota bacterium]
MFSKISIFIIITGLCLLNVFGQGKKEKPVAEELKQLDAESSKQVPPKVLAAGKKGVEELSAAGIVNKALQVGDSMPSFALSDANGKTIRSDDLLKRGHLVIVFYRGAWCPFCNLYLRALQKNLEKIKQQGGNLLAISVEPPERSLTVAEQNKLNFTVLSDPKLEVSRKFRIVYEMPKVTNNAVLELGFDIAKYNGMEKPELPLSATYVVSNQGKIVYAFLDPDYKKRAEPAEIIMALKNLSKPQGRK